MDQFELDHHARRRRRRRAFVALLLTLSLSTLGAAMSLAVFSDNAASNGSWTTGTVSLTVSPVTAFNVTGLMPGDAGSQTIAVQNDGTGDLRYALTSTATDADGKGLRAQLTLTIAAGSCAAPGTTLYSGSLSGAAFGSVAQGGQAGDRQVTAGSTDNLCFSWSLPLSTGNAYQNATTSATFTFTAEQTANNP